MRCRQVRYSEVKRTTFERKGGGKVFKVEQREKDRWNVSLQEDKEGGLEDRQRSNLSKRQKEGTSLARRTSSEVNNG